MKKLRIVLRGNVCVLAIVNSVIVVSKNEYEIVGEVTTILMLRNVLYECGILVEIQDGITSGTIRAATLNTYGKQVDITFVEI